MSDGDIDNFPEFRINQPCLVEFWWTGLKNDVSETKAQSLDGFGHCRKVTLVP